MYNPPVKRGDNKAFRGVFVIALACAMLLTSLMTMAQTANREIPMPDLGVSEFSADNNRPMDGDILTITVVVTNYGDAAAIDGKVDLWEGSLNGNLLTTWDLDPLGPSDESVPMTWTYDTTGMRGTRNFFVNILEVTPDEANSTGANNNATLEVPIFKDEAGFDKIYSGSESETMVGIKEYKGFIGLFENSQVTMKQDSNKACNVKIVQDQDYQFGIELAGSTNLDIQGCAVSSNHKFYITIMDNAQLSIMDSQLANATIRSLNLNVSARLTISKTTIMGGGIMVGTPYTEITDTMVFGHFVFKGGTVAITNTSFNLSKDSQAYIYNTNMVATEISFSAMQATQIMASGNSQVDLKVIWDSSLAKNGFISFDAMDTSRIQIWRKIDLHVYDTTDMPIKGATIEVYVENADYPSNFNTSSASDENGNLSFTLLSDIIVAGNDGYRGNYEFVGKFTDDRMTTYEAFVTYKLAMHPALTYNGSHDKLNVVFEPIPPKVCSNPYKPQGTLINGATLGLTGCMQVTTPVTYVNSTITAIQDKDFQAAIYIEGSGSLTLQNTTITGTKRWNIYVIGPSAYFKSTATEGAKSSITDNAIVGVDGNVDMSTININANIRGKFKTFKVGTESMIRGTWLADAASMNVYDTDIISPDMTGTSYISGGSISIGGGLFYINHLEVSSTTLSAVSDADMWGNSMPAGDDPSYWRWYMPGSSLILRSDGNCQVIDSQIHYDVFEMHCKAFNAERASFNRDIVYGDEATSGSLKSVTAPAVKVLGDAIVKTYFIVDLTVTNSLDGPIGNAPIAITRMGGGLEDPPSGTTTSTDGKASFILLAEKITTGNNHEWFGNYKVVVTGCPAATPYEFSVGGGQGDQSYLIHFPDCIPKIEGLQFISLGLNKTQIVPPLNDVELSGVIKLTYEGGITTDPNDKVTVKINLPASGTNITTEADEHGAFKAVFNMKNVGLMPADQIVSIEATYRDPSDVTTEYKLTQNLNITVLPDMPKTVIIRALTLSNRLTDKDIYGKENIVITGRAVYNTGTPVPAGSTVTAQIFSTDVKSEGTTGADGTFTITLTNNLRPKKDSQFIVATTVKASHPYYTEKAPITSAPFMDPVTIKGKTAAGGINMFLIIIIVVVIIIVAAVAGIFLYLRMKTWGTVVECGECGAFIPENATKCPKCGTEFESEVVKCSECDAWIPALATECPKCGVEFKKGQGGAAAAGQPPAQPGGGAAPPAAGGEQPAQPVAKVPKK